MIVDASRDGRLRFDRGLIIEKRWHVQRKLPEPTVDSFDLTVVLSALADPGRRAIMTALYHLEEPIDCAHLVQKADLGLSSATISHHYRILREAGLTRTIADGRKRIVRVRREDMEIRFPGLLQAVLGTRIQPTPSDEKPDM
jgi:DNA-binding transcriptional ArsR family regulator